MTGSFFCFNFSTGIVEDSRLLKARRLNVASTFDAHILTYGSSNHLCRRAFARRQAHQF
jgi:hypothetical protein